MNLSNVKTMNYKIFIQLAGQKNKPNSNPIKPNFKKAQMNVSSLIIKNCGKNDDFVVRINKANFQNAKNERKLNFNKGLQKKRLFSSPKNKPKQTQFKPCPELAEALSAAEGAVELANFRTLFPLMARPVRKKRYLLTEREIIMESSAKYHVSRQRQLKGVRKWKEKI